MSTTFDYYGWQLTHSMMVLRDESGETQLQPTALLVALDDTGEPSTRDRAHPVFGLGGCAILVGQYHEYMRLPWALMKQQHFAGPLQPLHASDLRNPTPAQIEALNSFFQGQVFFRLAALLTDQFPVGDPSARVEIISLMLSRLLSVVSTRVPFSKIALIFDRSERLGPQIGRIFSDLRVTQTLEGTTRQIPVELCDAPKRLCEPALEVADFIIHTAGRAVRKSIDGMPFLENPDFRAIFETQPQELSEFVRLDAAGWRRVAA
jgi:hypothetical protein